MNTKIFVSQLNIGHSKSAAIRRAAGCVLIAAAFLTAATAGSATAQLFPPIDSALAASASGATTVIALNNTANTALTVKTVGLRNTKGKVYVLIYNSEQSWKESEKDGKAFREMTAEVKAGSTPKNNEATVVFEDLPAGTYAIQIHHDENSNGKMDSSLGIPKEGYGMSNNPKIGLSMPKWAACKFDVAEGEKTIEIKAKY